MERPILPVRKKKAEFGIVPRPKPSKSKKNIQTCAPEFCLDLSAQQFVRDI